MRIHPLFERLLQRTLPIHPDRNLRSLDEAVISDWEKAGKPVVEEDTVLHGVEKCAFCELAAKRIKELEEELHYSWPQGTMDRALEAEAKVKELEAKLAQATWENLGDQRKMDMRNEARNAALEEAAKAVEFEGVNTYMAERIRGMKK